MKRHINHKELQNTEGGGDNTKLALSKGRQNIIDFLKDVMLESNTQARVFAKNRYTVKCHIFIVRM